MFFRMLVVLAAVMMFTPAAMAQCRCGHCEVKGASTEPDDCGSGDWDQEFFDCCRRNMFDFEVDDPCCRRPYFSAYGGASQLDNFHRRLVLDPVNDVVEEQGATFLDGWGAGGAVGYRVHPLARIEAEFGYRENVAETWFVNQFTNDVLTSSVVDPANGIIHSYAGMINMTVDTAPRRIRCLGLYGGAGIGIVTVDGDIVTANNAYSVSDSSFAYQFIGGVNYPITKNVSVYGEYKYLGAEKVQVIDVGAGGPLDDFRFDNHSVFFGVRVNP